MITRRSLLQGAAAAPFAAASASSTPLLQQTPGTPQFCFFSKHLAELDWPDLGRAVKDAGFDGVDLTVRARGHVLPAQAAADLPRAIDAIKAHGIDVPMVTTELTSANDPAARPLLTAAARSGVRYFKTGYWHYDVTRDVRPQVHAVGEALAGLAALARDCNIELGFHNHTAYAGAALWDIAPAMDRLDAKWAGYYFDPRHAVAEGGGGAWKAATRLVLPRLKMIALKDFYWEKGPKGWTIRNCPLGEGAVEWAWVAKAFSEVRFAGPVSLHFEYDIPAATAREQTARTLAAAEKDLAFARRMWAAARA